MSGTGLANGRGGSRWRVLGWGALGALLLAPAVAMRFTDEMRWDETDFIVFGLMLGAVGLLAEFVARKPGGAAYRLGAAAAILTSFLTVWANLAVGMIRSENDPYNLLFAGVVVLAWAGAMLARWRPGGMAWAMAAAAAAQALAALGGMASDPRGGVFSLLFAGPWVAAAGLFWMAGRGRFNPRVPDRQQ